MSTGNDIIPGVGAPKTSGDNFAQVWLEAYKDTLRPTARLVGEDLAALYAVMRRAIRNPEHRDVQERYQEFLNSVVERVPPERRRLPPEEIIGPTLEAKRFVPNGTAVSDMFAELLSRAFDRERMQDVHPSFVGLISQLSVDEAQVLAALAEAIQPLEESTLMARLAWGELAQADFERLRIGTDHLEVLGLVRTISERVSADPSAERPSWVFRSYYGEEPGLFANFYHLKPFGWAFMKATSPHPLNGKNT